MIAHAGKRLLAAENLEHIVDPRGSGRARKRRAQRLGDLTELAGGVLGEGADRLLERLGRRAASVSRPAGSSSLAASLSRTSGRLAKRKPALSSSATSVFARSFRPGMARFNLLQPSSPILA